MLNKVKITKDQKEPNTKTFFCFHYIKSPLQFKDRTNSNLQVLTSIGPFISTTATYWPAQDESLGQRPKFHQAKQATSGPATSCIRPLLNEGGRHTLYYSGGGGGVGKGAG